jgi:hypothetical protein
MVCPVRENKQGWWFEKGTGPSPLKLVVRSLEVGDRRFDVEIDALTWHIDAFISRSTRSSRHRRVDVEIDALKCHIDAFISTSTR